MFCLLGVPVLVIGLVARFNPLLVVVTAGIVAGLAAGVNPRDLVCAFGRAFNESRYISAAFLVLPLIGVLERAGLQARARALVARLSALTPGRLLVAYLAVRQLGAALGLMALGGHAAMVRPLIAPMAEGLEPDPQRRQTVRAHAAAADNVGAFFGEDIFVAMGSVLLIRGVLGQNHISADPLVIALWAIPSAILAFGVHAARLLWLDRGRKAAKVAA